MSEPDTLHAEYLRALQGCQRRNSRLFYLDGFLFVFGLAMFFPSTILAGYVSHFSDSASAAATLTMLFLVGLALPQPLGAFLSHRRERRKRPVVIGAAVQKVPVALLIGVTLIDESHPQLVLPATLVLAGAFFFTCGLVGPMWMDWIGRVFAPSTRGHTLGWRTFWMSLGGLLGALFSGWVLAAEQGPAPYTLLFVVGFVAMVLSIPCLVWMVEPDYPVRTRVDPLGAFLRRLGGALRGDAIFRRYVVSMTLFFGTCMVPGAAIWLAAERFPDWPGWDPDRAAGRWNIIMSAVQAGFGLVVGRMVHAHGPRPALVCVGLAAVAMPLVVLLARSPAAFGLVFVAFGVFQSAFFVAHLGTIYSLAPGEDRLPYFSVSELLKVPVLLVGIQGGAWLMDRLPAEQLTLALAASMAAPLLGLALLPRVARERASA